MKNDQTYFSQILFCIDKIEKATLNFDLEKFKSEWIVQDAIITNFMIIGECVSKISNEVKNINSEIPWQEIKNFRNFIVHEYFMIDHEEVWKIIENELPLLKHNIKKLE